VKRPYTARMRTFAALAAVFAVAGCSSSAQTGAGQGATMGMVGGAVAGAVGSLLWGGNVVEGAAKGAAVGAASGAATGAVSGSMKDSAAREKAAKAAEADPKLQALRKRIGDKNYASSLLLAQCRHKDAIASAQDTVASSKDQNERDYAMLLQGIAAEESGDKALAASLYPRIAQEKGGSVDKVRADALEGVIKVQATRREHGLPACKT
jgi:hypothetical protein